MPHIDKESDTLKREYRQTVDKIELLIETQYEDPVYMQKEIDKVFQRQDEIIKELEECTGVKIHRKTIEETLKENEDIQSGKIKRDESELEKLKARAKRYKSKNLSQNYLSTDDHKTGELYQSKVVLCLLFISCEQ
ncbi:MAG: hypothetical protein WA631_13395, partial [Nitrososphaeraceae archaeon]